MPALITHHLFGEEAVSLLPEGIVQTQEEMLAFLLGNQGPDPLFACFSTKPSIARDCHRLAHEMHNRDILTQLIALRDAVSHLPQDDQALGRAFCLGMLGHYVLDSTAHPFVYAQQNALCETGEGLQDAGSEIHALIESDIDSWMLWTYRHQSVAEHPVALNLERTERIERVAGAIISQVAWQVYGIMLPAIAYGGSVGDYEMLFKLIDGAPIKAGLVGMAERMVREHSHLQAMAHVPVVSDDCPAANLDRHPWADPCTGDVSTASFPDLFFRALDRWEQIAELYVKGDARAVLDTTHWRNYDGIPIER